MDINTFVNPPAEYRILPLWFWNGSPEEGEIVRQIREMNQKGVGGFCIAARSGLRIPYLSRIWFDRVRLAVQTAAACGLQVWFHEEYPYPGGRGAGQVTLENPQYRAQYLTFREITVQGGQQVDMELPWATVLHAMAVPLRQDRCLWESAEEISDCIGSDQRREIYWESAVDGEYHNKHYFTRIPAHRLFWKAPAGRWRILIFLQKEVDAPEFPGTHFDPLNPQAVDCFVRDTCGLYAELLEGELSDAIPGILVSEVEAPRDRLPWSSILPQAFRDRNGYDLLDHLPALITGFGPNTARVRYDYFQTLSELLRDSYHGAFSRWANDLNIVYMTDVPAFRNAHRTPAHVPGASGGREKVGAPESRGWQTQAGIYRENPKFAASLVHQRANGRAFNTCFRDTGWALTLQDMKCTADRLGALGCNFFGFHAFFYTLDGLRKHDAPPSQFHQNPYWKHFRVLADYVGRLSYSLAQGRHVADIALIDPVTSLWSHLGHPGLGWRYVGYDAEEEKLTTQLASDWTYLMDSLSGMQRGYDCLDPEMLQQARVSGGRLVLGSARYQVLIIPPVTNLERVALECIRKFLNSGGKVIALGLLPVEDIQEGPSSVEAFSRLTDMEASRMIRDYVGHELGIHVVQRGNFCMIRTGGSVVQNNGAVVLGEVLDRILPRRVTVQITKKGTAALLCHEREKGKERVYFFANPSPAAFDAKIGLRLPSTARGKVEKWDLETGRRVPLPTRKEGVHLSLELPFAGYQSHLVVVSGDKSEAPRLPKPPVPLALDIQQEWKVDPEEDNALRLDRFRIQTDPENKGLKQGWHKPDYADGRWLIAQPKPFAEQLRKSTVLLKLKLSLSSDGPEQPMSAGVRLPLVCWFRTSFSADTVPNKLALVMDRSAIVGNYQIYLNGARLPGNAFRPTFRYDHANITCAVGRRVSKGKNVLAVRVEIDKLTGGLVDAFYLFGRFGVRRKSNYLRLLSPVTQGSLGRLDDTAMPFYAGTVAYSQDTTISEKPKAAQFAVTFQDQLKGVSDIVEVLINGHSLGVRAWPPHQWLGETAWLRQGKNRLTLRITNTLSRLLTGRRFRAKGHKMVSVRI